MADNTSGVAQYYHLDNNRISSPHDPKRHSESEYTVDSVAKLVIRKDVKFQENTKEEENSPTRRRSFTVDTSALLAQARTDTIPKETNQERARPGLVRHSSYNVKPGSGGFLSFASRPREIKESSIQTIDKKELTFKTHVREFKEAKDDFFNQLATFARAHPEWAAEKILAEFLKTYLKHTPISKLLDEAKNQFEEQEIQKFFEQFKKYHDPKEFMQRCEQLQVGSQYILYKVIGEGEFLKYLCEEMKKKKKYGSIILKLHLLVFFLLSLLLKKLGEKILTSN